MSEHDNNGPSRFDPPPPVRYSVHQQGKCEALRHKWIESEKAGHDLGEWAMECWVHLYWNRFLRYKWLQHLRGETFWVEIDRNDFGVLNHKFLDSDLIRPILERLMNLKENLDIINWARDNHHPRDEVLEILEVLDINSRRIPCQFGGRFSQAI